MSMTIRNKHPVRPERFSARLTAQQKSLLERAAALEGQSMSQFVLTSAQRAAEQTIRDRGTIMLSVRDSEAIMIALRHPEPAGPKLRDAAVRYRALMGDQ